MHCKLKIRKKNNKFVQVSETDESESLNFRKYELIKILNKSIRLQLDSGSDLSIIYVHTRKKLGDLTMSRTNKVARSVTGQKIKFKGEIISNFMLNGKTQTKNFCDEKHKQSNWN